MISFDAAWAFGTAQNRPREAKAATCINVFRIEGPQFKCRPKQTAALPSQQCCRKYTECKVLPVNVELRAAVLLPALFGVVGAELLLLAVAHRTQTVRAYSRIHQRLLGGIGAVFAQRQVVFRRAALVAISSNHHLDVRMLVQESRILLDRRLRIRTDLIAVVIVEDVMNILMEERVVHVLFIQVALLLWSIHRQARRCIRRSAVSTRNQVIVGRLG